MSAILDRVDQYTRLEELERDLDNYQYDELKLAHLDALRAEVHEAKERIVQKHQPAEAT